MHIILLVFAFEFVCQAICESGNYSYSGFMDKDTTAKIQNLDPCLSNNQVPSGSCQCTFEFHPDGCACNLQSNQQYSLEQALGCLRSIPLTPIEKSTTIDLLKNYLSGYVFLDTSLNPPGAPIGYGKHDVDIIGGLNSISANTSYTNTFDFYEDIMVLLNKLKDPHTIFTPPCVSKFYYIYYYSIDVKRDSIDTPYYVMIGDLRADKVNMNGLHVYSSGTTENEGTMDPIEAISLFAEKEVPITKNPTTRFNSAAGYDFGARSAIRYKHPEHESMYFSYKSGSNTPQVEGKFSVLVSGGDVNQLKDECPIHSDHSTTTQSNNQIEIMNRIKTSVKKVWNGMKSKFNGIMNKKKENDDNQQQQQQQIQKLLKDLEDEQTKITRELQDRIRHKDLFSLVEEKNEILNNFSTDQSNEISFITKSIKSKSNDISPYQVYAPYPQYGTPEVRAYRLTNEKVGVLIIQTFDPDNLNSFAEYIAQTIKQFTLKGGEHYVERLIIDVRGNGGGKVRIGRQTLNFLFPQVGHPLYQIDDEMKTDINEQMAKLTAYITEYQYNTDEVVLDIETMQQKPTYYTQSTIKRTTTSKNSSKSLTVDLTDKFVMYMGNSDDFLPFTADWDLKRKELFSPENVIVISDGVCASTCSQFVKHIGLKHLGRIAGIGISDPRNPNARFDIGMASSGTVSNVESVQTFKNEDFGIFFTVDKTKLPKNLYRVGSQLTWSNKGGYGFTESTKELLLEYAIVDPDFRVEHQLQSSASNAEEERILSYLEVLSEEKKLLGSTAGNSKKCFSWEVDVSGAASKGNCKGCVKDDQHSVFGHPCSSRLLTEADGTSKIGIIDTENCVFSHCKVGYYRKNVDIGNGIFKDQCIEIPLGPNQLESDITPDKTLDTVSDSDICLCSEALIGTPGQPNICSVKYCTSKDQPNADCVCDTESINYTLATCQSEKKCTASSSSTVPTDSCACSGSNYPQGCKCPTIPSELTGISKDRCPCLLTGNDPRADGICPSYCTSKDQPRSDCVCNTESKNYTLATCQSEKKCTASSSSTVPTDSCACSGSNYPSGCKCPTIPSELTGISKDRCPCLATGDDPRADGICPAYCTSKDQPRSDCVCNTESKNYTLATCQSEKKCTASSSSTVPTDSCACSGSNYPSGCKCPTIPSELTGISKDRCPCLLTGDDPRADGICPAYCTAKDQPTSDCVCNTQSTNYLLATCQYDKFCADLTGKSPTQCFCTGDSDPRSACICTAYNTPNNCKCSSLTSGSYPKSECEKDIECSVYPASSYPKCIKIPPSSVPIVDIQDSIDPTSTKNDIVITDDKRDIVSGVVKDTINEVLENETQCIITTPRNEIYEEENMNIGQDHQFVIKSQTPSVGTPSNQQPILQPNQKTDSDGNKINPKDPVISVSKNGDLQIEGFTVIHFDVKTDQPVLKTTDDGILRLIDVIFSSDQREKKNNIITSKQSEETTKQSPFVYASGKQVIMSNVTVQPVTFMNCGGIVLNGSKGPEYHSLIASNTKFIQIQRNEGNGNALVMIGFTVTFAYTSFNGTTSTTKTNEVQEETCEWQTSAIRIEKSIVWFDSTTFTGLSDGALSVGEGSKVTLTNTSLLFSNSYSGASLNQLNARRNIICNGSLTNKAQIRAENVSFLVHQSGDESANKWILSNKDTCEIFGTVSNTIHTLYSPLITSLKAQEIKDIGGISFDIQGTSLIGCLRIWIKITEKPNPDDEEIDSVTYLLEKIATQWDSELNVTGTIPEDKKVVKKGKNLQIQILVGEKEDEAVPAHSINGSEFEAVNINEKNKGISLKTILIVVGSIVGALLLLVVFIIVFVACLIKKRNRERAKKKIKMSRRKKIYKMAKVKNHW